MKKRLLLIGTLLLIIVAGVLFCYKQGQLETEGSYYENLSDFSVEDSNKKENHSPLAQAYMKSITYEIINVDTDSMNATVKVSVPQVSDTLVQIVDQVLADNPDANANQIKELVLIDFQNQLESDAIPREMETLIVPIERELFEYKLAPDATWYDFTMGQLEDLYLEYFRLMIGELTNEAPND